MEDQALLTSVPNHILLFAFARCKFFSLTETPEDYTIIVDEEGFLGECQRVPLQHPAWGWRRKMSFLAEIVRQSVSKTGLFVSAGGTAMKGALIT